MANPPAKEHLLGGDPGDDRGDVVTNVEALVKLSCFEAAQLDRTHGAAGAFKLL